MLRPRLRFGLGRVPPPVGGDPGRYGRGGLPVIVSLTSIPGRLATIDKTLDSLVSQTYQGAEIRLYLGPQCPAFSYTGVDVRRVPVDHGPLTKLTPASEDLPWDALIITADDDIVYASHWLKTLVAAASAHPEEAIGCAGWNARRLVEGGNFHFARVGDVCDVIEGWAGAVYRRRFFNGDLFPPPESFRWVDDVWISSRLHARAIPRRVVQIPMATATDDPGIHTRPDFLALNRRAAELGFGYKPREAPGPYMQAALQLLEPGKRTIVEIGTMRRELTHDPLDGSTCPNCMDGHSTYLWAAAGHDVWTVDIDPATAEIARRACGKFPDLNIETGDGIDFLRRFSGQIDLLFLDGWDAIEGTEYAEAHLDAFKAAAPALGPNALVVIDDTDVLEGGKGRLLVPYLRERGYRVLREGRQTILASPAPDRLVLVQPLLTICIPSLHERSSMLAELLAALRAQPRSAEVEILVNIDGGQCVVGEKRNRMVAAARGRYVCHFDDDDMPSPQYLSAILGVIDANPGVDCVLIRGRRTRTDGGPPIEFDYEVGSARSAGRDGFWEGDTIWRSPGHLCPIRADIAKAVEFPWVRNGEDIYWVAYVQSRLKTAARAGEPGEVLYNYRLDPDKKRRPWR